MQVRSGTFTCTSHSSNHFTPDHLLSRSYLVSTQMCIARKITKAMIHFDGIPITCLPSGLHHNTITGGIHRRARTSRKVHPRMKLGCLINRIYTDTVTGSRLLQILIGNRLDGRNTFQHLVMALTQIHHLVKRLGLDIKLPVQHIQFLSGIDNQIGIRHIP